MVQIAGRSWTHTYLFLLRLPHVIQIRRGSIYHDKIWKCKIESRLGTYNVPTYILRDVERINFSRIFLKIYNLFATRNQQCTYDNVNKFRARPSKYENRYIPLRINPTLNIFVTINTTSKAITWQGYGDCSFPLSKAVID